MRDFFVHEIGKNSEGEIVKYAASGTIPFDASGYSSMKYGDPKATQCAAQELFNGIINDEALLPILLNNKIAITSSTRKVPTASFILAKKLIELFLNPFLFQKKVDRIYLIESERKGMIGEKDYGSLSERGRLERMEKRNVFFSDENIKRLVSCKVILFDDLIVTGTYKKNQIALLNKVGVETQNIIPIFWYKMSTQSMKHPEIENEINHISIKKLNDLLSFFYDPNLIINARTVKFILKHTEEELNSFFYKLKTGNNKIYDTVHGIGTLIKLYEAAVSSDGYSLMQRFKFGFSILDRFLLDSGLHPEKRCKEKIIVHEITQQKDLPTEVQMQYSNFKYSDPVSTKKLAKVMYEKIKENSFISAAMKNGCPLVISSSAFGEVPTAAYSLAINIISFFKNDGITIEFIKIDRYGDFETTHYGEMGIEERKERIANRKLNLKNMDYLKDKIIIIIDDLYATGNHEKAISEILKRTEAKFWVFSYLIKFSQELSQTNTETEEKLNQAQVKTVLDLKQLRDINLIVNARTIKFVLVTYPNKSEKIKNLNTFLSGIEDSVMLELYKAAISKDGYYSNKKFVIGFNILIKHLFQRSLIDFREIERIKNYTVGYNVTLSDNNLIDIGTGENLNEIGRKYSLMKYGSYQDILFFGTQIASRFIYRLKDKEDSLKEVFFRIKRNGEHIILVSPGSRNIESAQNFIFEIAVKKINTWLALNDLPTIILLKLPRLDSNRADYASLSKVERESVSKEFSTIHLSRDFFEIAKTHVIFADDIRITGTTTEESEISNLLNGALSFMCLYNVVIDPKIALEQPDIEGFLNSFLLKGSLDENVVFILNQQNFRPVQRMMRLLLCTENRKELKNFLLTKLNKDTLVKLYEAALSNNYLENVLYSQSVIILKNVLSEKKLINNDGIVKEDL